MLVYPNMILLDLACPQTVFSIFGAEIHLVGKDASPVRTDVGIPVTPTTTLADCPTDLDLLFVPGGLGGTVALMDDDDVLGFLAARGANAGYVTSVCTGSLLLGAAGLLRGYHATSHWYVRDLLSLMGATVQADRVVADRNRVTAGGVTAGMDFALQVVATLGDEEAARRIQLLLEYDPKPPFDAGSPGAAGQALADDVRQRRGSVLETARQAALRARDRLGPG
ncbi:MAG: DJ-1/PfpI family protein [Chloroflexota bacterium]